MLMSFMLFYFYFQESETYADSCPVQELVPENREIDPLTNEYTEIILI